MTESILNKKRLLLVDDASEFLKVFEELLLDSCPDIMIDKATEYDHAAEFLRANAYDLVVLDITGIRGFDLLEMAVNKNFKVAMFTGYTNPLTISKSHSMGAAAFLPKEKLPEIVPLLEHTLSHDNESGWCGLLHKLNDYYDKKFGL